MPIYEYRCNACGVRFEELVKTSDTASLPCPSCASGDTTKLMSAIGAVGKPASDMPSCAGVCPGASRCAAGGSCPGCE